MKMLKDSMFEFLQFKAGKLVTKDITFINFPEGYLEGNKTFEKVPFSVLESKTIKQVIHQNKRVEHGETTWTYWNVMHSVTFIMEDEWIYVMIRYEDEEDMSLLRLYFKQNDFIEEFKYKPGWREK